MHTNAIAEAVSSVVPGSDVVFRNLIMVPLLSKSTDHVQPGLEYVVLDEGLSSGLVEVTEVSEDGRVPELRVVNRGPKPTLIVDGKELVGAKQNRVVNLTILAGAHSTVTIPVSCVEAGRWRARSRVFESAPRAQYASGRAKRTSRVSVSMRRSESRSGNQAEVWADIAEKSERLQSESPTGAMDAIFVQHADFIDACVAASGPVERQAGALFIVAGRIVGLDLFDSETTLRKLLPKLVRSAAVEALDAEVRGAQAPGKPFPFRRLSEHFLSLVEQSEIHSTPALGIGEDIRLTASGLTGAALVAHGRAVHLAAFALA